MKKIKLGLIGKNIQASKSPQIYSNLLQRDFEYQLIDCDSEKDLPSLLNLSKEFDGVSVTAPYKNVYLNEVEIRGEYKKSINTLRFNESKYEAINTDFLAIKDLKKTKYNQWENIVILGDGAMSQVVQEIFRDKNIQVLSRKEKTLSNILDIKKDHSLIINTCLRDYVFKIKNPDKVSWFWSLNYGVETEKSYIESQAVPYSDGMELLELQAKYALKFWSL